LYLRHCVRKPKDTTWTQTWVAFFIKVH